MHSTEALPLPRHPDVARYRKLAKELLAAVKSGDRDAIHRWAKHWMARLFELSSESRQDRGDDWLENDARRFAAYWTGERKLRDFPPPKPTLAHAQFVIARVQGFANWTELLRHIETLRNSESAVARFEAAVDAVVKGDIESLRSALREHPELVRERSSRAHRCTLLHYVSANGVEGYRQKTPRNVVAVTKLLLESGADVNATAHCYSSDDTALGLAATSTHPHDAGVMIPLLETLVAAGADVNHEDGGWNIIRSCLANGQPQAAAWLADHGARVDLAGALGIGRLDLVKTLLSPDGTLLHGATQGQLEEGFRNASWYGQLDAIRYLLDAGFDVRRRFEDGATGLHHAAYDGNAGVVELLLSRGAPVELRDHTYNGNALDWALWAWGVDNRLRDDPTPYYAVVALLRRAGEALKDGWYASEGGRQVMQKVSRDPRMQAALRGQGPSA
jgi:hypothetical protein